VVKFKEEKVILLSDSHLSQINHSHTKRSQIGLSKARPMVSGDSGAVETEMV
jgi:hypothetical protein